MKDDELQRILSFNQSEVWNAVLFIIEQAVETEVDNAINHEIPEDKRAHQCGRAEGAKYIKTLLNDTRDECLRRSGVILPEKS